MATLVLAAAGASLGGAVGGGVAGLSAAAMGRAAGAVLGNIVDQKLLGSGAAAVETGRVDRFRVMGAREGAPIPRIVGGARVAGQAIWASRFLDTVQERDAGGKGAPKRSVRTHRYSVSFAVALCEGPVDGVGRIWLDGRVLRAGEVEWRLHHGGEAQTPDPLIAALEGDDAPAYRGLAYLVFEDLALASYGDRVPQVHVEIFRNPRVPTGLSAEIAPPLADLVQGVALSPGSGEFSLATEPVRRRLGPGVFASENVNSAQDRPDLLCALDQLGEAAPACRSVLLIVTWFGDDLRCGRCALAPAVETRDKTTEPLAWSVAGLDRATAPLVGSTPEGRPVFGGTPSDQTVAQAIRALRGRGYKVLFYPFILMNVPAGSGLPDPYGAAEQPAFPWRGRITLDIAPGRAGSADQTAAAAVDVAAFVGAARAEDFEAAGDAVVYRGPEEWSLRRFILHYAHLCAAAGGVDAFCIGSELRGLTTIRAEQNAFPAVEALRALAGDVRGALGPETKIGYAADWSEYSGHRPADGSDDVFFHLDPLWADDDIDFVGIDNYMPLSDWRDGEDHADAAAGSIYALGYLQGGIEGGEGFDWYYASAEDRAAQRRTPIMDTAYGEDWVFRVKDLRAWWGAAHHDRPGGARRAEPTAWVPGSKPIWFTELGCPAVDKGTNQPNVFVDPKSSESAVPYASTGAPDPTIQRRYLQAVLSYWADPARNPASPLYDGRMIEVSASHVWTWDARPWPDFPGRRDVWADGANHALGHWITGRIGGAGLAETVAEICVEAGLAEIDVDALHGVVEGYARDGSDTGREALQPLMLAYGFDAVESGVGLRFAPRGAPAVRALDPDRLVAPAEGARGPLRFEREGASEAASAVRVRFFDREAEYAASAVEARRAFAEPGSVSEHDLPLALSQDEAQALADRWLSEAAAADEELRFSAPRSALALEPGDVVAAPTPFGPRPYRIDRVTDGGAREIVARRVDAAPRAPTSAHATRRAPSGFVASAPLEVVFLDLPPLSDLGGSGGPHVAAFGRPWPGAASVWRSADGDGWTHAATIERPAVLGALTAAPAPAAPHRWGRGAIEARLWGGALAGAGRLRALNGANAAAIEAAPGVWEVLQFAEAELIGADLWRLTGLLRGQAGTEALIGAAGEGARFVLLNDALTPLEGAAAGLERLWRVGPAHLSPDDPRYVESVFAASQAALRPFAPAGLRARREAGGWVVLWARRAPGDADGWAGGDAHPLPPGGAWRARVEIDGVETRRFETAAPGFAYTAAMRAQDGALDGGSGALGIAVCEISPEYGAGPEARIDIDG